MSEKEWWVTAPLWIPAAFVFVVFVVLCVISLIASIAAIAS